MKSLKKNNRIQATDAHISIIGHITRDELRRYMTETEAGNGFGNRFLWICTKRSKILPEGGNIEAVDFDRFVIQLKDAIEFSSRVKRMHRNALSREIWHSVYGDLSEGRPGMTGTLLARADPQVVRLSCIYALLDRSDLVQESHLMAALAFWKYVEQSVRFVFGDAIGDPLADEILSLIRDTQDGLTRTAIH